jgi:hypothetical protein
MSASQPALFNVQEFTDNGVTLVGGRLYTYAFGTTTQKVAYTDPEGTVPQTYTADGMGGQYIALNVRGELPTPLYLGEGPYDICLRRPDGSTIWTRKAEGVNALGTSLLTAMGSTLIGWMQAGIGAILRNVMEKLRERVSVQDFGAVNDGNQASGMKNRIAIQAAIDAMNVRGGGTVIVGGGGVYYVDVVEYISDAGGVEGITSIKMKDNVALKIEHGTTIRLKDAQYGPGAFYRLISSGDVARLTNAMIYGGGTIDGNRAAQTPGRQADNILLEVGSCVKVIGIRLINANGNGLLLRGGPLFGRDVLVQSMYVDGCNNIGIQCAQTLGLRIAGNFVANCVDNGIDWYGEDGDTTSHSTDFSVCNNNVFSCQVGYFLETAQAGVISNNTASQCTLLGIAVNRINGEPRNIIVSNNSVTGGPTSCRVSGDTAGVLVHNNAFDQYQISGVDLGDGVGNCSNVDVSNNTFTPLNNTLAAIRAIGATISFCTGKHNIVNSSGIAESLLFFRAASLVYNCFIDSFKVTPFQVGADVAGVTAKFQYVNLQTGTASNVAGPVDIAILPGTAGTVLISSFQPGVGRALQSVPFMNYGGTMVVGTLPAPNPLLSSTPIASVVAVQAAGSAPAYVRVNLVAGANNYLQWGVQYVGQY